MIEFDLEEETTREVIRAKEEKERQKVTSDESLL